MPETMIRIGFLTYHKIKQLKVTLGLANLILSQSQKVQPPCLAMFREMRREGFRIGEQQQPWKREETPRIILEWARNKLNIIRKFKFKRSREIPQVNTHWTAQNINLKDQFQATPTTRSPNCSKASRIQQHLYQRKSQQNGSRNTREIKPWKNALLLFHMVGGSQVAHQLTSNNYKKTRLTRAILRLTKIEEEIVLIKVEQRKFIKEISMKKRTWDHNSRQVKTVVATSGIHPRAQA